jgi:hypothetical protein
MKSLIISGDPMETGAWTETSLCASYAHLFKSLELSRLI